MDTPLLMIEILLVLVSEIILKCFALVYVFHCFVMYAHVFFLLYLIECLKKNILRVLSDLTVNT